MMFNHRSHQQFPRMPRRPRRPLRRRAAFRPELGLLEDRKLLSVAVAIPTTNPRVDLSTIFWNGEAKPLNPDGLPNIPSPASVGAAKTITIKNSGPEMIYPFLRGQNGGVDPNASPVAPYDPQDRMNHEFREYVGFRLADGSEFLGLPPGASVQIQVPLALWDGDNLYLATDGTFLTSSNVFGYDPNASITVAGSTPVSGTTWVEKDSNYVTGVSPLVMFYYSGGPPITLPNDAPAQLTEVTFRDQYLGQFISDPFQTFPLVNYDVSYVNNLVAPVSMEASDVPITYQTNPLPAPPTYYGSQDFGWLATDRTTGAFEGAISDFIKNTGAASVGQYFKGNGWPQYYNPNSAGDNIPSGANLFANSPLNAGPGLVHTSSYDPNRWLLTSSGNAPIQAGGAGVGQQGFVFPDATSQIFLGNATPAFVSDLQQMLKQSPVYVSFPGSSSALAQVSGYVPNPGGMPYVTLKSPIEPSGASGKVYAFTRAATDYAITDITNLWYSWAQYHVQQYQNFAPESLQAALSFTSNGHATNEITLASTPPVPLDLGMTVTAPSGVPSGTTILKIDGNHIYLSQIPDDTTPASQVYTFSKPQPIAYDSKYTQPYTLVFDALAAPDARKFAASVYEAMAAEAAVSPLPPSYLPYSMNLVSQVIQFYAKLPGYTRPDLTGPTLVGQVRDVVKSILRGVYDFNAVPDQAKWYPNPSTPTPGLLSGQNFNVFNLDPYVWFVHKVEGMSAYGFSVDDDVSNPTATGPLLAADGSPNHSPNNLQIEFGGTDKLGNPNQWFPTIPWGELHAMATIGIQQTGDYAGDYIITFMARDPNDALRVFYQINNPGTGQVGAYISAPGFITPGTTLVFKGPTSGTIPQIVLSQTATTTDIPIPVTITAIPPSGLGSTRPPAAPIVTLSAGRSAVIGSAFVETGTVSNLGAQGVAAIDFGDGAGVQSLLLGPGGVFSIGHIYNRPGKYTLVVAGLDANGRVTTRSAVITVAAPSGFGTVFDIFITTLYLEELGRVPDAAGLAFWTRLLAQGIKPRWVASRIFDAGRLLYLQHKQPNPPIGLDRAYADALQTALRTVARPPFSPRKIPGLN